jgi:predicted nucleotidyltransferase
MAMEPTASQPISAFIRETIPAEFLTLLRAHGVTEAYLFGSVATGHAGPNSDLDLLVSFDRSVPLFDQLRLAERLGKVCGRSVDLMTDIHPAFSASIVPTLVRLPL